MKVRWTEPSIEQLEAIFDFIAKDNLTAARHTVLTIREAVLRVAQMPTLGRIGRVKGTREIVVAGTNYLVAYRILNAENTLHMLAVYHGAQLWPDAF